ncbi:hypothetical protein QF035_003823 [Streptomyces umbrinus]|uniref:Uncharacterized protein n=1 Tax=Streptomyces umbrinus TaxID=67370 RepID=A0ABU0SRW9_9ACTN|nr:hypothetical protein [Streptomyces umbrinus]MDQ1026241.1 hypothetical protein [Streptomyces umbrinus]
MQQVPQVQQAPPARPLSPVGRPPLPVRGAAASSSGADGDTAGESPGAQPFVLPMLSPEDLAADQPSIDMLRRVRRGLTGLPESD